MAWSWSHTAEAYRDAEANLHDMPDATLCVVAAEWRARTGEDWHPHLDDKRYRREVRRAYSEIRRQGESGRARLRAEVWARAAEHATCDNGGFNAWMCPFGCGCHTVPFSRETPADYVDHEIMPDGSVHPFPFPIRVF